MSWLHLALANLRLAPLASLVNMALMGLGTASIVVLLLAEAQLSDTLARNGRGIDLVIGAKGSPFQLVLAAVYHIDIPPGNISLETAERWEADPRVRTAIPLALGDSFRGSRVVGTTPAYAAHYGAELAEGNFWESDSALQAVVGASAAATNGLGVGDRFNGSHGIAAGGHEHEAESYRVVGVLKPTGTVLDRLILTSLESYWALHDEDHDSHSEHDAAHVGDGEHETHHEGEHHEEHEADHEADHDENHDHADHAASDDEREITALLLSYRTPLAAITMPREVNEQSTLQAAAPAVEIARVLALLGVGLDGLRAFAWCLILIAALSIFAALYGSLSNRETDLATLRYLGATRGELLLTLLLEGALLTLGGVLFGFALGHGVVEVLAQWLRSTSGVEMTGLLWLPTETLLLAGLFGIGLLAASLPAIRAYRTDVARTMAKA